MEKSTLSMDGKIIRGLLDEIYELYVEFPKVILMDVGIIPKIQHVQHFQISAHETAVLHARKLDLVEVGVVLEETLAEAYKRLRNVAVCKEPTAQ